MAKDAPLIKAKQAAAPETPVTYQSTSPSTTDIGPGKRYRTFDEFQVDAIKHAVNYRPGGQVKPEEPLPRLSQEAVDILHFLQDEHPKRRTMQQISEGVSCDPRTAAKYYAELNDLHLVDRPDGPKSGAALTENGLRIAQKIAR